MEEYLSIYRFKDIHGSNINSIDDLNKYIENKYYLNSFRSKSEYIKFVNLLLNIIINSFNVIDLKQTSIKFEIKKDMNPYKVYECNIKEFIIIVVLLYPLIMINNEYKITDKDLIMICDTGFKLIATFNGNLFNNYLQNLNDTITEYGVDFKIRSYYLSKIVNMLEFISYQIENNQYISLSLENDFLKIYQSDPKVKKLLDEPIDRNKLPKEISNEINAKLDHLFDIFEKHNTTLYNIMKSGIKIKRRQIQEIFISYGQIPNVYGNIIMYLMEGNGLRGIKDITSFYIQSTASRMSNIINKMYMGDAGYLQRNIWLLARTLSLSKYVDDCGTKHLLKFHVKDKKYLKMIHNKYYSLSPSNITDLKIVNSKIDTHLVGKTIYIRSIIKCGLTNECCHKCYGTNYKDVLHLPGMSILNVQSITRKLSQDILSVKHLVNVNSDEIKLNDKFNEYFIINDDQILLKRNKLDFLIAFDEDYIVEQLKSEVESNIIGVNYTSNTFYVYINKELIPIEVQFKKLTIQGRLFHKFTRRLIKKKYYYVISNTDLDDIINSGNDLSNIIFELYNQSVITQLTDIKNILKSPSTLSVDEYVENLIEKMLLAKMDSDGLCFSQVEVIVNRLIIDENNNHPNYTQLVVNENIIDIGKAIINHNNVLLGLSYEQLQRQLISSKTYEKSEDSYLTPLFQV